MGGGPRPTSTWGGRELSVNLRPVLERYERNYNPAFLRAADFVLNQEGGIRRPGISGDVSYEFTRKNNLPNPDILWAIKDNALRRRIINAIYYDFWTGSGANRITNPALQLVHFDASINHGITGASKIRARSNEDPYTYIDNRIDFYRRALGREGDLRQNPGWLERRMPDLEEAVQLLIQEPPDDARPRTRPVTGVSVEPRNRQIR